MVHAKAGRNMPKSLLERISRVSHLSHPVCELGDELMRLNARLATFFAPATEQSGVSPLAFAVFIYVAEARSPSTVAQIGRSIGRVRQVVQRAVNELILSGWVETLNNPNHKRAPLLQLSRAGETFKRESDDRVIEMADAFLQSSKHRDFQACVEELRAIRQDLELYIKARPDL